MSLLDDDKWINEYNKKFKSYLTSDFLILSADVSENHKKFNGTWTIEFKLLNLQNDKLKDLYDIHINLDGSLECTCLDYKIRCKKYDLPCKHLLHIFDCIKETSSNDEKLYFFKNCTKLTSYEIDVIKTKILQTNYCLLCYDEINKNLNLDKHIVDSVVSFVKIKINTKFNNCDYNNCHNYCLSKLYNFINE
jgi:hypothetical protein